MLIKLDDSINNAEQVKFDKKILSLLREKKRDLENAIIKNENLIHKCILPKIKNVKCLYCTKLFANESNRDHHIVDMHQKY